MDNPGFSYQILPEIGKYVVPVILREGKGDRKAAIRYMKTLIKIRNMQNMPDRRVNL